MKLCPAFLAACLGLAVTPLFAAPSPTHYVPADAKWFVHVDVDALLRSQVGEFLEREFLEPKLTKATSELKQQFDIELDWRKIHSLTAYGSDSDFKRLHDKMNGVLIIQSDLDIAGSLNKVLEKLETAGGAPFKKLQEKPFVLYGSKDVVGTPVGQNLFILARSRDLLEPARLAVENAASRPGRAAPKADSRVGFLTLSIADTRAAGAALPPQARLLQDTQGVQFVAGEQADQLFVNASLEAKDSAVAQQLQQMLQGVLAFAQMTQTENQDLQQLSQSAKISGADNKVTIDLQIPVKDAIAKLGKAQQKKRRG